MPPFDWFQKNQPRIKDLKTLIEQRREQINKLEEEIKAAEKAILITQKEINRLHTYDHNDPQNSN
jgi:uncharacterized protein HemX